MLTTDHPTLMLLAEALRATQGPASGEDIAKLLGHAMTATGYTLENFAPDPTELEEWREIVAGRRGFNGYPQALLRLMSVSDEGNLARLRRAYPAAVKAFLEERER